MASRACALLSTFAGVLGEQSINMSHLGFVAFKVRQAAIFSLATPWIDDVSYIQVKPNGAVVDLILCKWNDGIKDWVVVITWSRRAATITDINKAL